MASVGAAVVGVNAAAVSVNCEMTVLAADVLTTATSGVRFLLLWSVRTSTCCNQNGNQHHADSQFEFHGTSLWFDVYLGLILHYDHNSQHGAKEDTTIALHSPCG